MIVPDASAWIEVLAGRLDPDVVAGQTLWVPPHFDVEVLGGVRALHQRGLIDDATARRALDRHLAVPFTRDFEVADARSAWSMRESLSFADGWYAAMARRLDATWVTADHRAGRTARGLGVPVQLV